MGPNTAFGLVIFGVLGVYCEFIWPGRVWQAIVGLAASVTGGYFLLREGPTALGLELVAGATVFFLVDAFIDTRFVLGLSGTWGLTAGFLNLIAGEHRINPLLVVPCCILFGAITMALNWAARRSRFNKRNFSR